MTNALASVGDKGLAPRFNIPAEGSAVEVADGLFWVRMPLPFALNHVNLWLLRDGDGFALIDTGLADVRTRSLWEKLFTDMLGGRPITRLICTHHHPDHMGLASLFTARFGLRMMATRGEWSHGRLGWLEKDADFLANWSAYFDRFGLTGEVFSLAAAEADNYRRLVDAIPLDFIGIKNGDRLRIGEREWHVLTFGGHSPEHACFWCPAEDILIAGDQVLPKISPAIGAWHAEPEGDPLTEFLASLNWLKELSDKALVLPSHGRPFIGPAQRCTELLHHHDERLQLVLDCCERPSTGADIMTALFPRPLTGHELLFAVSETLSHINHLVARGSIKRAAENSVSVYTAA